MKKIISFVIVLIVSLSSINTSNAFELESKLYKSVIISKLKIEKDYSKEINEKIVSIFTKLRYKKDISTLERIEVLLKSKIRELNNKTILSAAERKKLNLYNNLYYRTVLLLNYNLK